MSLSYHAEKVEHHLHRLGVETRPITEDRSLANLYTALRHIVPALYHGWQIDRHNPRSRE